MSEKKDYDRFMNDYEREVFEWLGMEFKYSPREKNLISEFLRDWRWGRAFYDHFFRFDTVPHLMFGCKCALPDVYWKWFEKKWESRQK